MADFVARVASVSIVIDLHCHLLAGIDDGPATIDLAVAQARLHVAAGIDLVVCTPHVDQSHRNTPERIAAAHAELSTRLAAEHVDLALSTGAEVSLSRAIEMPDDALEALHLAGSDWLLLEPPLGTDVPRFEGTISSLIGRGHRVLVAHPERCAAFHHDPRLLEQVVQAGGYAQVTATSLTGRFGRTVEKLARQMVDAGLVHVVASDAHDDVRRPPGLAQPLEQAGYDSLIEWACQDVPSAMLQGGALPPRPEGAGTRRRGLFRHRR